MSSQQIPLARSIRDATRKGNSVKGVVESTESGLATIRLVEGGARLSNLSTLGGDVAVGDEVVVSYRSGIAPVVESVSERLSENECIYQAARGISVTRFEIPNVSFPPWEIPPWEIPPWEIPPWNVPPFQLPPWGGGGEGQNWWQDPLNPYGDVDIGIQLMGNIIYCSPCENAPNNCGDIWGQIHPPRSEIQLRFWQADIWDEPYPEMAWPLCGWDTFGTFPWTDFLGEDFIVIPRRGLYYITAYKAWWDCFSFWWDWDQFDKGYFRIRLTRSVPGGEDITFAKHSARNGEYDWGGSGSSTQWLATQQINVLQWFNEGEIIKFWSYQDTGEHNYYTDSGMGYDYTDPDDYAPAACYGDHGSYGEAIHIRIQMISGTQDQF